MDTLEYFGETIFGECGNFDSCLSLKRPLICKNGREEKLKLIRAFLLSKAFFLSEMLFLV